MSDGVFGVGMGELWVSGFWTQYERPGTFGGLFGRRQGLWEFVCGVSAVVGGNAVGVKAKAEKR